MPVLVTQVMLTWGALPHQQGGANSTRMNAKGHFGFQMVLDSTDVVLNGIKERTKPLLPLPSQGPRLKQSGGGDPVSFKRS